MAKQGKNGVAERLRVLLAKLEVSQRDLANITGHDETYISRIVNGKLKVSLKFIYKLKNKFPNININYLLYDTGEPIAVPEIHNATEKELISMLIKENELLREKINFYEKTYKN